MTFIKQDVTEQEGFITNCPNCGGLLDGDEHSPYVKCECCGAKVWSEREVS